MTREQIIQWYEDELARLRQAPHLNGCDMTPEWAKQIEVHTAAVAALRERETVTNRNGLNRTESDTVKGVEIDQVKWISVEDRLPDASADVNLCTRSGIVGTGYYDKYRKSWVQYYAGGALCVDVTHWMLLPEPPEVQP